MFLYKFIQDEATNKRYWIDKATLVNDEGPDPDGADWYEIDLQPFNADDAPIIGLDLIDYGGELHITKGLNPNRRFGPVDENGRCPAMVVPVQISSDTLIIPADGESCNIGEKER